MKIVITGGTGAGKTTLINELAARGYKTVPEAAIEIIALLNSLVSLEGTRKWRTEEPVAFQKLVWARICELEVKVPAAGAKPVFCDRGLLDGVAYMGRSNPDMLSYFHDTYGSLAKYDKAFVLDTLSNFDERKASGRLSNRRQSEAMGIEIMRAYAEHGVPVVRVPEMDISERCGFVLNHI